MTVVRKRCFQGVWVTGIFLLLACRVPAQSSKTNALEIPLKRYVVFNDTDAGRAVAKGAKVVLETRGLKAVLCPPSVAEELGLQEDIPIRAADTAANTQVLATRAQAMGLTGRGRKIVVLDSGYNYNHPELRSSYLGGRDWINHDDDPFDDNGHGSHVAGIITGDGVDPKARGIAPDAGIVAGKVLDSFGQGFTSDLVSAIYWAVDGPDGIFGDYDDFQPDAINISIGTSGGDAYPSGPCDNVFPPLTYAIKYAVDRGIQVIIAAGNNGSDGVSFPGCISYATTVGAVTRTNTLASFSGTGPSVAIVAPGVAIYSAYLGTGYRSKDGTSHAAPLISGAIALLKEAFPNASMNDVQNALFSTAMDLGVPGKDSRFGWGRVDACFALGSLTTNFVDLTLDVIRTNGQVLLSWPTTLSGFVLEENGQFDLSSNGWHAVTNAVQPKGNKSTIAIPRPAASRFYRLDWQ